MLLFYVPFIFFPFTILRCLTKTVHYYSTVSTRSNPYHHIHHVYRQMNNSLVGHFISKDIEYHPVQYSKRQNYKWSEHRICKDNTFVLLLFFGCSSDKYRRDYLRQYIHQDMCIYDETVNYAFVVSAEASEDSIQPLLSENMIYNDMIITLHKDSHYNLTRKSLDALTWVMENCKESVYIIKVDTDMWVDLGNLVKLLKRMPRSGVYSGYYVRRKTVVGSIHTKALDLFP